MANQTTAEVGALGLLRWAIVWCGLLVATVALSLIWAGAAQAAGSTVVTSTSATPRAFVPDWDGHTDATVIQYQLAARSNVFVQVIDARRRLVVTLDSGVRDAGMHLVSWDGRNARGTVQRVGTYGIRVVDRGLIGAGAPSASQSAGVAISGGASQVATVALQAPPVAVTGVELSRSAIGRTGRAALTSARFTLSTTASVSAAIVDRSGRAVAMLAAGRMTAGVNTVRWNGRRPGGRAVADGEYELLVAATGPGRPTSTTRVPLRVDRTSPTARSTRRTRARIVGASVRIPLNIVVNEPSSLISGYARRTTRTTLTPGRNRIELNGATLGISPTRRARSIVVRLQVRDTAGNVSTSTAVVFVPAAGLRPIRTTPTTSPPPATGPDPAAPTGGFPWPVGGIVTSEFGMRGGRPHTGLDIAVPAGTPIHPIAAGTISFVGSLGGYGNLVIVEHDDGLRTYYAHMSGFGGYAVGDRVAHVDVIGLVGCTGSCTGPHVHFETRVADVPRDPRSFLSPR